MWHRGYFADKDEEYRFINIKTHFNDYFDHLNTKTIKRRLVNENSRTETGSCLTTFPVIIPQGFWCQSSNRDLRSGGKTFVSRKCGHVFSRSRHKNFAKEIATSCGVCGMEMDEDSIVELFRSSMTEGTTSVSVADEDLTKRQKS